MRREQEILDEIQRLRADKMFPSVCNDGMPRGSSQTDLSDYMAEIDAAIEDLKEEYTIVIVTHNMQQATRISDRCAFFLHGELVEEGETEQLFSVPKDKRTEDYITGRFG